jgi:uncharacterized protein YjcR
MAERKLLIKPSMFRAWLKRMGWNDTEAGRKLGASRNSIRVWAEHGAPFYIGIAAAALEQGGGDALNIHRSVDVHRIRELANAE